MVPTFWYYSFSSALNVINIFGLKNNNNNGEYI